MLDPAPDMNPVWQSFVQKCQACQACDLAQSRQHVVVWRGGVKAPLMILGEGPGADEDRLGIPFVGRSGKLLDQLLTSFDLGPQDYHICNIVKCRPPGNRVPSREEAAACRPLLKEQMQLVRPRIYLLMGATAYRYFTGSDLGITKARGIWTLSNDCHILPTFHPAYVLRDPSKKPLLWQDLAAVRQKLEELQLIESLQSPDHG
ncbi:MAG: uracil-DNA glycosylase [Clostridiaceae bacterium]|jgi:DNA polymerase|nr:uracil-DNA glycosylase [Clostridiaceae bacterium]